jgi:Pyruvate/2-oxoacid:ferredoxin oxidoreductase gamma subunit
MGGFARVCDLISLESMLESIRDKAPVKKDANVEAARAAYDRTKEVVV